MRNALLTILFIFAVGQLCHYGLPWWAIAPVAAIPGWFLPQTAVRSLLTGFAGGFLLWLVSALFADRANAGILSERIGKLFLGLSATNLTLITGLLGGLLAGMGCLTGRWARDLVSHPAKAR